MIFIQWLMSTKKLLYRNSTTTYCLISKLQLKWSTGWLVVFSVPSPARSWSFRDGGYCPLRRTWSSVYTPFPLRIEPRAVAWQSITQPLHHASSTKVINLWPNSLNVSGYVIFCKSPNSQWWINRQWYYSILIPVNCFQCCFITFFLIKNHKHLFFKPKTMWSLEGNGFWFQHFFFCYLWLYQMFMFWSLRLVKFSDTIKIWCKMYH